MSPDDYNRLADSAVLMKDFLLKHSAPLVKPTRKNKKCGKVFIKVPDDVKKARSREFFSTNVKLIKLLSSVMLQSQMKNYFGNLLSQRSSSQMSAFVVNGELIKTRFVIRGLIILRHLAPHLKLRLLTKTFSIKSVIAFASHFFPFYLTLVVYCLNH